MPNVFLFYLQRDNSFSILEISKAEASGVGTAVPIWRIRNNDFDNWEIGRVYIESDYDYRVTSTSHFLYAIG